MTHTTRILILDDEVISAMGLQADLIEAGIEHVYIASNYEQALTLYHTHKPHYAIVDINLQEQSSGLDFIRQTPDIEKVILLSGYSEAQYRDQLRDISYVRFFEKPTEVELILEALFPQ